MRKIGVDGAIALLNTYDRQIGLMLHRSLVNLVIVTGCLLGCGASFSDTIAPKSEAESAGIRQELIALRASAQTPEERISAVEEWIKLHPPLKAVQKPKGGNSKGIVLKTPLTEEGALNREILQGLKDTRVLAKNLQEEVALIADFQRLNADTLESVKPPKLAVEKSRQIKQELVVKAQHRLAVEPDNQTLKANLTIQQIRAAAKSPEERTYLTAQFLELERKSLGKNSDESSIQSHRKSNDQ